MYMNSFQILIRNTAEILDSWISIVHVFERHLVGNNSRSLDSLVWDFHRILVYMNSFQIRIKHTAGLLDSWISIVHVFERHLVYMNSF